jgi:hypothetical protein
MLCSVGVVALTCAAQQYAALIVHCLCHVYVAATTAAITFSVAVVVQLLMMTIHDTIDCR